MSKPYNRSKKEVIAFKVDENLKKRIDYILKNTFHEDQSQLMRYILQMYLPIMEKQISEEKEKDE